MFSCDYHKKTEVIQRVQSHVSGVFSFWRNRGILDEEL